MKFLVLYTSSMSAQERMDRAGMAEWMAWKERNGDAVVDFGSPLKPSKHFEAGNVSKIAQVTRRVLTIIQADSREAAEEAILRDHLRSKTPDAPAMELLEFATMPGM
jgi:hypothetical protein